MYAACDTNTSLGAISSKYQNLSYADSQTYYVVITWNNSAVGYLSLLYNNKQGLVYIMLPSAFRQVRARIII